VHEGLEEGFAGGRVAVCDDLGDVGLQGVEKIPVDERFVWCGWLVPRKKISPR